MGVQLSAMKAMKAMKSVKVQSELSGSVVETRAPCRIGVFESCCAGSETEGVHELDEVCPFFLGRPCVSFVRKAWAGGFMRHMC